MVFKILMACIALCTTDLMAGDPLPPGSYRDYFQPKGDETWYACMEKDCTYDAKNRELCCWCPSDLKDPIFVRSCAKNCVSYKRNSQGKLECEDPQIHGPRLLKEARKNRDRETMKWLRAQGVKGTKS